MKKLIRFLVISIFGCLSPYISYAQTKPAKADASSSKTVHGVIYPLNETQTWATVFPDKLFYWNKGLKTGGTAAYLKDYPQNMDAKRVKKGEVADYTFTFVSEGIKNVRLANSVSHPAGGVLIEYTYNFPCELRITDKDNNVLKTFVLNDEENEMTARVHPAFLKDAESGAASMEIPVVSGFKSQDDAIKEIDAKRNDYMARIEYNAYYDLVGRATEIISRGYGHPKFTYAPVVLEVNKKEKTQFPALGEKVDMLKSAINEYFTTPVNDGLMERLLELGEYFESNYDATGSTKDVVQLYAFNSAMAYLLGGSTEDAYRQFRIAEPTLGFISMPKIVFETIYPVISDMNNMYMTRNEPEAACLPIPTVEERKQMEEKALAMANQQAAELKQQGLAARNITDVPGYVMTNDGEKREGNISIKFVELSTQQILDTDIARLVWVRGEKSQSYRTKSVSYFMAGEKRFEPVTLPGSAAIKAIGALMSGTTDNNYFMEVVHTKGNYTSYVDPRVTNGETYYVKNNEDGTTGMYELLIKGGKDTEKFLGDRSPELLERIKAQEFTSSRESLSSFVDALADSVK